MWDMDLVRFRLLVICPLHQFCVGRHLQVVHVGTIMGALWFRLHPISVFFFSLQLECVSLMS